MSSEKDVDVHPVEDVAADPVRDVTMNKEANNVNSRIIDGARAAAEKERNMTLIQGLRLYPKAIAWSVLISTCIVMEGYDITLVNNFCESLVAIETVEFVCSNRASFRRFPSVQQKVW